MTTGTLLERTKVPLQTWLEVAWHLVDSYVGGVEEGAGGRSRDKKQPVVVACERVSDTRMGRVRLARLPDASAPAIADFFEHNVEPGSVLVSDKWASYPRRSTSSHRGVSPTSTGPPRSGPPARGHIGSILTSTGWPRS